MALGAGAGSVVEDAAVVVKVPVPAVEELPAASRATTLAV